MQNHLCQRNLSSKQVLSGGRKMYGVSVVDKKSKQVVTSESNV